MQIITKQYKVGRAVMFYDVTDPVDNKTTEMVPKDEVVKQCENGQLGNVKIQWWEGKPIVRLQSNNIPIIKLGNAGNVLGTAERVVRGKNREDASVGRETSISVADKAVVVGKVVNKRPKKETVYAGYDLRNTAEQGQLNSSIDYRSMRTLNDLFTTMATDFKLKNTEVYRESLGKKIKLSRDISSYSKDNLMEIQLSMATYLMNMASIEIRDTYIKYRPA